MASGVRRMGLNKPKSMQVGASLGSKSLRIRRKAKYEGANFIDQNSPALKREIRGLKRASRSGSRLGTGNSLSIRRKK